MSSHDQKETRSDMCSYKSIVKFNVKLAWTRVCQGGRHGL